MADWYVSSAAYATYTAFQTSHAYSIGDLIVPTAPALKAKWVLRCTVAGTSTTEPAWPTTNNSTTTSGTATFKNVTGQSAFFWTAAAGDLPTLLSPSGRASPGDRVFLSSDHSEIQTSTGVSDFAQTNNAGYGVIQYLCVNRAGSTPPVAADLTTGASIACAGTARFEAVQECYYYGITFSVTGTNNVVIGINAGLTAYFNSCQLWLNTSSVVNIAINTSSSSTLILDNTTLKFGATTQKVSTSTAVGGNISWINTASALAGATFPSVLFQVLNSVSASLGVMCRGVDLSALTGTLVGNSPTTGIKCLFDSCKIASGVTRYDTTSVATTCDLVELVNCYDGTNIISEVHQPFGDVTTEFTITLSGGAVDNVGSFSHKMVSNANVDKFVNPLCGFWMDVENTSTGSSETATVEIISSATLNNDEIALYLQYEGTAGSSVASFADSFAGPLVTPVTVTTSTATWNSSPATPQKQKLQVTFTPQHAGRVRGQVRLGKASTTVYINPQITIT